MYKIMLAYRVLKGVLWELFMGLDYKRIHFKTSSVLFRETPIDLVQTPVKAANPSFCSEVAD